MTNTKQELRAITVWRPWGSAIADYGKDIENRTWKCFLPIGTLIAIHNGVSWDEEGLRTIERISGITEARLCPELEPKGVIIAIARFQGLVTKHNSPWFSGPVGWLLSDAVRIEPVPAIGKQGFWLVEGEALEACRNNYAIALKSKQGRS